MNAVFERRCDSRNQGSKMVLELIVGAGWSFVPATDTIPLATGQQFGAKASRSSGQSYY